MENTATPETTTTATTSAPTPTPPAAPSAPPALTLEQARAARLAAPKEETPAPEPPKEAPAPTEPPKVDAKPEPPKPETKQVDINLSPEQLQHAAGALRDVREANAKIQQLEAQLSRYSKSEELRAKGQHLEAIRAAGYDLDAAIREEVRTFQPADETPADPATQKLTVLEQELAALKARESARASVETEVRRSRDVEVVGQFVTENATTFPLLSTRKEWVKDAYAKAESDFVERAKKGPVTPQEQIAIVENALTATEAHHAELAKLYAPPSPTPAPEAPGKKYTTEETPPPHQPSARRTGFSSSIRGATATPATKSPNKALSLSEAREFRTRSAQ